MSLILEALRKSEAERRRGLPPDVHAELPPAPAPHARGIPAWAWLLLGVGLFALVAWLLLKPRPADELPAPATETVSVEAAQPLPSRTPLPPSTTPAPATLPQTTPPSAPPVAQTAPSGAPASSPIPAPAPAQMPIPQQTAPPAPATRIEPPMPVPAPAAPRASATSTEPGRVLALGELDAGAREALPPLRMSMHLWNENPAQRIAIIDGRRVSEGDAIGEVRVVRIERDGVLLEWQGRGIRLPVR